LRRRRTAAVTTTPGTRLRFPPRARSPTRARRWPTTRPPRRSRSAARIATAPTRPTPPAPRAPPTPNATGSPPPTTPCRSPCSASYCPLSRYVAGKHPYYPTTPRPHPGRTLACALPAPPITHQPVSLQPLPPTVTAAGPCGLAPANSPAAVISAGTAHRAECRDRSRAGLRMTCACYSQICGRRRILTAAVCTCCE
jgi:hypothetical protein